jgi:hypothetical protein
MTSQCVAANGVPSGGSRRGKRPLRPLPTASRVRQGFVHREKYRLDGTKVHLARHAGREQPRGKVIPHAQPPRRSHDHCRITCSRVRPCLPGCTRWHDPGARSTWRCRSRSLHARQTPPHPHMELPERWLPAAGAKEGAAEGPATEGQNQQPATISGHFPAVGEPDVALDSHVQAGIETC